MLSCVMPPSLSLPSAWGRFLWRCEAHRVDEGVKSIRDKAVAMPEYARQAKDGELIGLATEIRLRAERKAGQLLTEMREKGERDPSGRGRIEFRPATQLADIGVSKTQSSRWQKLGAMDDEAFEARVSTAKRQALASVEATEKERAWLGHSASP